MGGNFCKEQYFGRITAGISAEIYVQKTIDFVYRKLPEWRDDPDRAEAESEPDLNPQLEKFLNSSARNDFPMVVFHHEEPQAVHRHADLSVSPVEGMVIEAQIYTIYDPILIIECKRLPAPSSEREKEYVTGTKPDKISGGIQRFKMGLHGAKLNLAVMIGYIQDGTVKHWHGKVNEWITELVSEPIGDGCEWTAKETLNQLEKDVSKGVASYRSIHSRTGNVLSNEIKIHHLWISMKKSKRCKDHN